MNKQTIPSVVDVFVPCDLLNSDPFLLKQFNEFNDSLNTLEQGKLHLLSIKEPELIKLNFDYIFDYLPKLMTSNSNITNIWIETYRPIVLDQYRRVVRLKLTAMDERMKRKRAKLRTQTIDALFLGLYRMITKFEEINQQ